MTLNDNPKLVVRITAHTDSRGSDMHNNDLSQRRAQSVVDYLISKGIDPERLMAQGYGRSQPKITDAEISKMRTEAEREAAHQVNRRTEFEKVRDDYVPRQRFEAPVKDSLGQNIRISRPILSAKDSVFFNLKKEERPSAPQQRAPEERQPQQQPAQQEGERREQPAPQPRPAPRDTTEEPAGPPVPEH
jgi:hypothetical protein